MHTEVCKNCKRKAEYFIAPANDGKDEAEAIPICRDCLVDWVEDPLYEERDFFKWVNV
jgi:hypothetical protein